MMLRREPVQQNTPAQTEVAPASLGLRALYEATLPSVYRYIYSKVGNREEAEDLTSQVYLKALRGLDEARDPNAAQAWLFQVARTTIADYWRVFYRLRSSSLDDLLAAGWDSPAGSSDLAVDRSAGDRAEQILSQLPERYREVLTYRFLMNCSLKETAARMNLTEANVKVLQFRALKKASRAVERDVETDESC
jgi:RNA polymerase sigma-70 factor, ECF subfamily